MAKKSSADIAVVISDLKAKLAEAKKEFAEAKKMEKVKRGQGATFIGETVLDTLDADWQSFNLCEFHAFLKEHQAELSTDRFKTDSVSIDDALKRMQQWIKDDYAVKPTNVQIPHAAPPAHPVIAQQKEEGR